MKTILVLGLLVIVLALTGIIPLPRQVAEALGTNRDLALVVSGGLCLMVLLWTGVRRISRIDGIATKIVANLAVIFSVVVVMTGIVAGMVYGSPTLALKLLGFHLVANWTMAVYVIMSSVTFVLYGYDKGMARRHEWRVPGAVLHFLELLGGWPGATLARGVFHHKVSKEEADFRAVTWFIALGHMVFWTLWFFWRE